MVVMTFEIKRRTFLVSLASIAASLPVAGIVGLLFGAWGLLVPAVFVVTGLWLWDSHQRKGLKLLNAQAILDTRRASNGVLFAAGQPVPEPVMVMHQRQFIPVAGTKNIIPVALGSANFASSRSRSRSRGRLSAEARFL